MKTVGIIPARYRSSRYPGKPLVMINGKPMVIRVAERVAAALGKENTYIATEDQRIVDVCLEYGYNAVMTGDNCKTGTDRLYEAAKQIEADIYLNIQGDEPIVEPADILKVAQAKIDNPAYVTNGMCPVSDHEDPTDVNLPKVLANGKNELVYMSRLAVPGVKNKDLGEPTYMKQVCIYGFTFADLEAFVSFDEKTTIEHYEDIEILRFFDTDIKILMVETSGRTIAVDVPSDVQKVEEYLNANNIA